MKRRRAKSTTVDPVYLVAKYLERRECPVGEQELLRDMAALIEMLWRLGFEVEASFQDGAARNHFVSPEIDGSLKRLRASGVLQVYDGEERRFSFVAHNTMRSRAALTKCFASHEKRLGRDATWTVLAKVDAIATPGPKRPPR